jgi:diamine N-acetyltransferase
MTAIPQKTVETVARSIFREASDYGFGPVDFIRLINELMDLCKDTSEAADRPHALVASVPRHAFDPATRLPVRGDSVTIRDFEPDADTSLLEAWLPDEYGRYFMLSSTTAQSISLESLISSTSNRIGIVTLSDGSPIGAMAYLDHNPEQRRAELRKLIGEPRARGRGLAEEATRLWVHYGMESMGLEKIYVSTLQTHIRNIRLNEAIGFRVEGILRNEVLIDGERHDVLRMGLCRT